MITPALPIRVELNGELLGNYSSTIGMIRGIDAAIRRGVQGLIRAYDNRGQLLAEHTGLRLIMHRITPSTHRPSRPSTVLLVKKGV